MASLDDVRRIALSLPEVEERASRGRAMWHVGGGRSFVGERPFTTTDERLREIVVDAWYTIAPPRVAAAHPDLR